MRRVTFHVHRFSVLVVFVVISSTKRSARGIHILILGGGEDSYEQRQASTSLRGKSAKQFHFINSSGEIKNDLTVFQLMKAVECG